MAMARNPVEVVQQGLAVELQLALVEGLVAIVELQMVGVQCPWGVAVVH